MIARITFRLSIVVFAACTLSEAHALPPLGLTQIVPSTTGNPQLDVIDGSAYVTSSTGLWKVDSTGNENLGSYSVPVKATDGYLYALGGQGMLYRFDATGPTFFHQYMATNPDIPGSEPEVWKHIAAIDEELRGYGDFGDAARFYPDGTVQRMAVGITRFVAATPKGWALGDGEIVGTIGSGPVLWEPHAYGETYPLSMGGAGTIRDRYDGSGVNISNDVIVSVLLGDEVHYFKKDDGTFFDDFRYNYEVIVSHSNFTVINDPGFAPTTPDFFAFFPGINPAFPDRVVPLLDIFPQLATIDIDSITSAASVDGYLYLTIRGSDGLYLFGAPDPSLVPEPAAIALLAMVAM